MGKDTVLEIAVKNSFHLNGFKGLRGGIVTGSEIQRGNKL